jgi:hypothetical protein
MENMNYEGRACCRGKKSPARVEVQAATNHDEKEQKKTNHQRPLFDLREHDEHSNAAGDLFPSVT